MHYLRTTALCLVALVAFAPATLGAPPAHLPDEEAGETNPFGSFYLPLDPLVSETSWTPPTTSCPGGVAPDTDGDGVLDIYDSDDDCDFLADTLETDVKFGLDPLRKNTDNEGPIDGYDLRPLSSAVPKVYIKIKKITNGDGDMDCCLGARWGDPFFEPVEIRLRTSEAALASFTFTGLSSCDSCHPHDKEIYTTTDFPSASVNKDLVSDILRYTRDGSTSFPRFYIKFILKDHDVSDHDRYDISPASGHQDVYDWTETLEYLSNSITRTLYLDGNGDGNADNSGLVEFEINTDANHCAVVAASKVASGDSFVSLTDVGSC